MQSKWITQLSFYLIPLVLAIQIPPSQTSVTEKTVELAIFIDQYLYHHWTSTLPPSTSSSIHSFVKSYLDVLVESLNLIYAHPSLRSSSTEAVPIIGFHLTHTQLVWKQNPLSSKRTSAPNYLEAFCDLANKENWAGNRWDHALLLTGVDLNFPNGTNYVAGISWDNSMCNRTYSCSVVEGKTFRSVMTAVHEIGHSLGIEHDGLKYNFKCPSRGYIMSSGGGEEDSIGKIAWSSCSSNNLKAFLSTAPNVLSNQVACLNNFNGETNARAMRGMRWAKQILPGQRFNANEQCRRSGVGWVPSRNRRHIKRICSSLHCNNTSTNEIINLHPALEGTLCGKNKICRFGECVPTQRPMIEQQRSIQTRRTFFPFAIPNIFSYFKG